MSQLFVFEITSYFIITILKFKIHYPTTTLILLLLFPSLVFFFCNIVHQSHQPNTDKSTWRLDQKCAQQCCNCRTVCGPLKIKWDYFQIFCACFLKIHLFIYYERVRGEKGKQHKKKLQSLTHVHDCTPSSKCAAHSCRAFSHEISKIIQLNWNTHLPKCQVNVRQHL